MEKKSIELKWIEKGGSEPKKQISIMAELDNGQLKLISVKCFPKIICLTCGIPNACPQMT